MAEQELEDPRLVNVEEIRRFAPLDADHPMLDEVCPGCSLAFAQGDEVTLINIGPGDNADAREKARRGASYTGVAVPVHWACATGEES